jgi:2-polyprenyl-3-methyl-5-hydroxy-6-metoxy-1,4-benzoquinol methylase
LLAKDKIDKIDHKDMKTADRYIRANKRNWEQKARSHFRSRFYDVESFRKGRSSLRPIEISAVGAVAGKRLLHLQCHFGMDTLSWARFGAKVVGVDFSEEAVKRARDLSKELQIPARFIRSDLYDLKRRLRGKFDIIFVSYWLSGLVAGHSPVGKDSCPFSCRTGCPGRCGLSSSTLDA